MFALMRLCKKIFQIITCARIMSRQHYYVAQKYSANLSCLSCENRPAVCHDRSDPTVAALDLMRFIYLPDYETLIEQLVKLHMYAAVPSVLLIDDLDNYFTDETIKNDSFVHIARTCALIIHSMKSCSRILKMNVYVCAWTNSILTNNFLQTIYFRNIWNLTEEDEKIILLEKFAIGLSSKQSYKYHKFKDGMRVLQQICHSIEA
ncbi:uncharacterized protein LOC114935454 isoform X5 [Nylanderia fulva]|uniref:uncharacterized protein LOC114935454 isoform X5 n=1 Tax=Nylanderia fulva TaxID=613905 RepID=UPI0010FADD3A|nr:uncharacterized protein LOC114935454 isoform X5 [Nylanderia fulva]